MVKKRGLGRSLEALLTKPSFSVKNEEERKVTGEKNDTDKTEFSKDSLAFLLLKQIQRGKYQPRRDMNPDALQELAESIRAQGVIQPIVVRRLEGSDQYEIIAGERRWRAAELAGLTEIPVIIRDVPDEAAIAMALIENIQRENLNPIEAAAALQKLMDEFDLTHQQVAEAVGKSRASITNYLRLLLLNHDVKTMLETGQLEMGHARALLSLPPAKQLEVANMTVHQGLSVRQTEKLVQQIQLPAKTSIKKPVDPDLKHIQDKLTDRLRTRVNIEAQTSGKGKIIIHYNDLTEFDHLLTVLQN